MTPPLKIHCIDSHTGGEPTRVVVSGGPDLGVGRLAERRQRFREEFDHYRRAIVCEPRGSDVIVGALLVPPHDETCDAGVIFFNNVGTLGMCVHGAIGLAVTLRHQGMAVKETLKLDTPVGAVTARFLDDNHVAVTNVNSYRFRANVEVFLPEQNRSVTGDVAWGGNWFFLCEDHGLEVTPQKIPRLMEMSLAIKQALAQSDITGLESQEIDHIELFGPPSDPSRADSRNFVICPGNAYDRSPCGTGTSAKVACMAAAGKLEPGQLWRQESITGSVFTGSYESSREGDAIPTITGSAYVTAETTLLVDAADPFGWGL